MGVDYTNGFTHQGGVMPNVFKSGQNGGKIFISFE